MLDIIILVWINIYPFVGGTIFSKISKSSICYKGWKKKWFLLPLSICDNMQSEPSQLQAPLQFAKRMPTGMHFQKILPDFSLLLSPPVIDLRCFRKKNPVPAWVIYVGYTWLRNAQYPSKWRKERYNPQANMIGMSFADMMQKIVMKQVSHLTNLVCSWHLQTQFHNAYKLNSFWRSFWHRKQ